MAVLSRDGVSIKTPFVSLARSIVYSHRQDTSYLNRTRVQAPAYSVPEVPDVTQYTYEDSSLNPTGRDASDDGTNGTTNFINRKNYRKNNILISTLNTRTISQVSRKLELINSASKNHADVICLQEHRIYHEANEELLIKKLENYHLITSSATKNSCNASVSGVGILISSDAYKACISIEKVSDRIVIMMLNGNPLTTIINCYSPTNASSEEDVTEFYKELTTVVSAVPAHNMLFICGDFNAKLGTDNALFSYHTETNRNGDLLNEFANQFNLTAANTNFQKKSSKLWSFTYPGGVHAQLDYILVRRKWQRSIKDCQAYNSFENVGSGHRIVSCKCKMSYRSTKPPPKDPMKSIDWKRVIRDGNLRHNFAVAVHNRYQLLLDEIPDRNPSNEYNALIRANREVSLNTLPKRPKLSSMGNKYTTCSSTPDIQQCREKQKTASITNRTSPTTNTRKQLQEAKEELDEMYKLKLESLIQEKTMTLEKEHEQKKHSSSWKTLREITNKKTIPLTRLKGANSKERLYKWFQHFKNLLGTPEIDTSSFETDPFFNKKISNPLPISTKPFSLHELRKSLENVKISKAPGLDGIPAFLWKELLYFCNKTFEGNKPEAFSTSCLKPIPKTGDLGSTDNYQEISLTAIASKIYNSMLLSRISKYIEPILRHNQNGFRKGRSTLPQILAIRRIIEEIKIAKKEESLIFIDFSKAFDSISRSKMFHILSLYGIPPQIIDAMKIVYENASCVIQSPDGTTEPFLTFHGVLQGDTLAPYLFVIVVDYILRQSVDNIHTNGITIKKQTSRRHPSKHLTDLDYADDMALISDTLPKAQELLNSLKKASNKIGLFLNAKKTKYMTINVDANHPPVTAQSGQVLEEVLDFKFLGSYIADSRKDFMTRKGQAWDVCNKL